MNRAQFEQACITFERKPSVDHNDYLHQVLDAWKWVPHSLTGYGYLARRRNLHSRELKKLVEVDANPDVDEACVTLQCRDQQFIIQECVVYSATYQVPAYCFNVHDTQGCPLDLNRILLLQILNPLSCYVDCHSNFALTQNDHPTLGIPFYYLHPCQTSQAVSDLLEQDSADHAEGDERFVHWLDTWFAAVSSAIIF